MTSSGSTPRGTSRWVTVGGIGVLCGLLLGWLLYSLTASVPAAVVVGAAVAAILLGLAVGGVRQSRDFAKTPDRVADARARQAKVHEAMEQSRNPEGPQDLGR